MLPCIFIFIQDSKDGFKRHLMENRSSFFLKKNIFIKVAIAIVALFLVDTLLLLILGRTTEGTVIEYINDHAGGARYPSVKYPVVEFQIRDKTHKFNGNHDADYYVGDTVQVIYRPWWPRRSRIDTFWGITKRPLIQGIIALVVWYMIYSSFKPAIRGKP